MSDFSFTIPTTDGSTGGGGAGPFPSSSFWSVSAGSGGRDTPQVGGSTDKAAPFGTIGKHALIDGDDAAAGTSDLRALLAGAAGAGPLPLSSGGSSMPSSGASTMPASGSIATVAHILPFAPPAAVAAAAEKAEHSRTVAALQANPIMLNEYLGAMESMPLHQQLHQHFEALVDTYTAFARKNSPAPSAAPSPPNSGGSAAPPTVRLPFAPNSSPPVSGASAAMDHMATAAFFQNTTNPIVFSMADEFQRAVASMVFHKTCFEQYTLVVANYRAMMPSGAFVATAAVSLSAASSPPTSGGTIAARLPFVPAPSLTPPVSGGGILSSPPVSGGSAVIRTGPLPTHSVYADAMEPIGMVRKAYAELAAEAPLSGGRTPGAPFVRQRISVHNMADYLLHAAAGEDAGRRVDDFLRFLTALLRRAAKWALAEGRGHSPRPRHHGGEDCSAAAAGG